MLAKRAGLIALVLAALPLDAARADDPLVVLANFNIDNNRSENRAQGLLRIRLNEFVTWINERPGAHRRYPSFDVRFQPRRPSELQAAARECACNAIAIVWANSSGGPRVEASADIDIGRPQALSALRNPHNLFQPVVGVIRLDRSGRLAALIRMYEAIIVYGVLVRAFEQEVRAHRGQPGPLNDTSRRTINLVADYLDIITADARKYFGAYSERCVNFIERNVTEIRTSAGDSNIGRRFRASPAKTFNC